MAYQLFGTITAAWVPEGANAASVPSAQSVTLSFGPGAATNNGPVQIIESTIGTLTAAQVNTACAAVGSLAASYFGTLQLGELQGWSTGQP
jgi:hypothetical protein